MTDLAFGLRRGVPAGVAALVYWLVAIGLRLPAAWEVAGLAMGRLGRRRKVNGG